MDIGKGDFYWFIGVVEDRNDPEEMGRVKVRALGFHTDDKTKIPTESLPWAQVLMPVTSASLAGIGQSATGIVQGSWVIGYYLDGDNLQQPFVLGTVPSYPYVKKEDKGFYDPSGVHPVRDVDADTPYSARESTFDDHPSYITKVDLRQEKVEEAIPPKLETVGIPKADSYYERPTWTSPEVHGGSAPVYPYNKVHETESGHVFEVDDTPGGERISQFHNSGTNWEVLDNGDQTMSVVGNNYTVVFGNDNIYVKGNVNFTVDGDMRHLIKGNYHLEVEKDYTINVKGSRQTNINNNDQIEIGQEFASNVNENYSQRVGGGETRIIDGFRNVTVGDSDSLTVAKSIGIIATAGEYSIFAGESYSLTTLQDVNITARDDMNLSVKDDMIVIVDGDMIETITGKQETQAKATEGTLIKNNVTIEGTSSASVDHVSNGISGFGHTHTEQGDGAETTTPN